MTNKTLKLVQSKWDNIGPIIPMYSIHMFMDSLL